MSEPLPSIPIDPGSTCIPGDRRASAPRTRLPVVILIAAMVLGAVYELVSYQSVRAQEGGKAPATDPAKVNAFIVEIQRTLDSLDTRMEAIAAPTLAAVDANERLNDQLMDLMIAAHSAEANYGDAKLAREIAEIEIIGYRGGTAVQELAVAEGEIKLARDEMERARNDTAEAKTRLARISRLANESAGSLHLVFLYTDRLKAAELGELKAKYVLELAQGKKKVLVEFTQHQRLKELQADIERKRSIELGKQSDRDLQKARLQKLQSAVRSDKPTEVDKQVLDMLDQAMLLENTIRADIDRFAKVEKTDSPLQKEIHDLTNQLQNVVHQAEAVQSAAQFARLKSKIDRAAKR
ncbi:MAG: hypothetical protein ACLQGP_01555 [Isosphaeraceae bacterium]